MKSHKLYAIFVLLIVVILLGLSNSNVNGKEQKQQTTPPQEVNNLSTME
ncbi:hypothetical protein MY04_3631 [Flammeovirga sp. MY04]|nr:hypothetical protein [Flammeovirga sp. MY04]ANQ50979.1 hypothetical protein MY04_3631 [Flammeovirga sp. MY04]